MQQQRTNVHKSGSFLKQIRIVDALNLSVITSCLAVFFKIHYDFSVILFNIFKNLV